MSSKKKVAKTKSKPKTKVKETYTKYFIHYFYCLAIIALLLLTSININKYIQSQKVLGAAIDVSPLQNERIYWQNIIAASPTYIDAYLQLAKIDVELGNTNEATIYINKALSIDPNPLKIPQIQHQLGL